MATQQWALRRPLPARPAFATGSGLRLARQAVTSLAPVLVLYVVYTLVRWALVDRGPALGPRNAARVLNIEEALQLDWERPIQRFGLHHDWLIQAANWYYVAGFLPVLLLAAALAAWRAPAAFTRWRQVFAVSLGMALVGFALFPLAPPRLLPAGHGYVDTLMSYGPHYYGDAHGSSLFNGYGRLPSMVNVYAAMPSMHIAWSAIAGILLAIVIGRRWAWGFAVAHPLAMAFTVVVTANHYVLDVLGGLVVLGLSTAVVALYPALIAQARLRRSDHAAKPRVRPCRCPANAAYGD
jgi:hypothetical protein